MRISGTPAEIAFQTVSDLFPRWLWIVLQQLDPSHDHPRSAVSALQCVAFPEPLLHGMQFAILGEAFNRRDARAIRLDR